MKKIIENLSDFWDFSVKPSVRHFLNLFWLPKIQIIRGRKFHCLKKNFDFDWYYVIDLLHEKIEHITDVNKQDIINVAKKIKLNIVYMMAPGGKDERN